MRPGNYYPIVALCLLIALLVGLAAGAGSFMRGDGETASATTVRGEDYEYLTSGVYAYNQDRFVAEGVGWDYTTLFVVVPALLGTLPRLAKGSLRASLAVIGLLGYLFYQYLMYAVSWAFGPLFPLHIAIYSLSFIALVWIVSRLSVSDLARRASSSFPRRRMAVLSAVMATVLVGMWIPRIAAALSGEVEGIFFGQGTLVVQAMDLGMIVPLAFFTAVTAWQGRPIGYLLSSVLVVKTVAMASAICAMLLLAWGVEGVLEIGPLVVFATFAAIALYLGMKIFGSVRGEGIAGQVAVVS